jgi:hypothetical protein
LTDFANYLHKNIGATGVYIGKLEPPLKPIEDDADDSAHIDSEAPLVIKFKHADKSHEKLMVGAVLNPDQGIIHGLYK